MADLVCSPRSSLCISHGAFESSHISYGLALTIDTITESFVSYGDKIVAYMTTR